MSLSREETFTAIVVKLECESRTRLAAPRDDRRGDRYDQELEVHKVRLVCSMATYCNPEPNEQVQLLYKTNVVFPSAQLQNVTQARASYTLPAGKHEYHFQFKVCQELHRPFIYSSNWRYVAILLIIIVALLMNSRFHSIMPVPLSMLLLIGWRWVET